MSPSGADWILSTCEGAPVWLKASYGESALTLRNRKIMKVTEEALDEVIMESLARVADEGADIVSVSSEDDPSKIIKAINDFLSPMKNSRLNKPKADPNIDNWIDRAIPIGGLWGQTMVRHFGWYWASLIQHEYNDIKVIAVVNEDRSLAIFPFHYCFGCLENHIHPTVLLAFNMLKANKISPQPAGEFVNLMDGVWHIVPPG